MSSPTEIMLDHINLSKRDTHEMIQAGGLTCLTRGVLGLMEAAAGGDIKAVDIVINRIDGLISDRVAVKPIIVEVMDYGEKTK